MSFELVDLTGGSNSQVSLVCTVACGKNAAPLSMELFPARTACSPWQDTRKGRAVAESETDFGT